MVTEVTSEDGAKVEIPRVNLIYEELVTGIWNNESFARNKWVVCVC